MRKQKIYQIDAFADAPFKGNPAAVCILDQWLPESQMQDIAMENNLAETAFVVKEGYHYHIRWFTPEVEVALCGHATLASAFVLFEYYKAEGSVLQFHSLSGPLSVERSEDGALILDFPADNPVAVEALPALNEALGVAPEKTMKGKTDYLLIYKDQQLIETLNPNFFLLNKVDARGVIVSAKGDQVDFVSRFFAPQSGVSEDPVTGSAHTTLTPYWSGVLNKTRLKAQQLSKRGGNLHCELHNDRVKIKGKAVPYLKGEILL